MDVKKIVEEAIIGMSDNIPISQILRKAQVVAAFLGNSDFSSFVKNEQYGYAPNTNVPNYRIVKTQAIARFYKPFIGFEDVLIHPELIENKTIQKHLSSVELRQSLFEIEELCNQNEGGSYEMMIPVFAYSILEEMYKNQAKVHKAWHRLSKASLLNVIELFKSNLLGVFLEMDKSLDWNLDFQSEHNKPIITQIVSNNITATIANIGDGSVNAGDITVS